MNELGILDLLTLRGFDPTRATKLVRHEGQRYSARELIRRGWLDAYQALQKKPLFDRQEFLVSFIGLGGTRARFVGVYRIAGKRPARATDLPAGCPYTDWVRPGHYFYDLRHEPGFEDLEHRVVIDWGRGTRMWHQRLSNKEVVEILPKGQLLEPFNDYLEFQLTNSELKYLYAHQEGNKEWRARLSAVAGVYLVLANTTGAQYVGSAYGAAGIWGRWSQYARNGHGGNAELQRIVKEDPAYPENFAYSILQILPLTLARDEVLKREELYKRKLGSRAKGLNSN